MISEAAIPLSFVGMLDMLAFSSLAESGVPFDGDRVKELVRGPKWVSFSFFVNFQDIMKVLSNAMQIFSRNRRWWERAPGRAREGERR